jgi:type II secretory pathway pseudopilin PulG
MASTTRSRRLSSEDGITLTELMVAMAIMVTVLAVFGSVLASVEGVAVKADDLGQANDQVRTASEQIDREMRSGNVLYDPALENGSGAGAITSCTGCLPYYTIRIYTQTNADTRAGTNDLGYTCVLWQINSQQQLLKQTWPPDQPEEASGWQVVATGVVNRTTGVHAFSLDGDPLKGGRTLNVTFQANNDYSHFPQNTVRVDSAYTGRNTSYGYPTTVCSQTPT